MTVSFKAPWEPTHPTATAALADITHGKNIRVFGIGEYHRDEYFVSRAPLALDYFSGTILPHLVRHNGVRLLGWEYCNARLNPELETYLTTTTVDGATCPNITEGIKKFRATTWGPGLARMFRSTRKLRRNYPLSVCGLKRHGDTDLFDAAAGINENCLRLARAAMRQGLVLALYTGAAHCNADTVSMLEFLSYVPALWDLGLSPEKYLSVRLVVPEECLQHYREGIFYYEDDLATSLHAPRVGVYLRQLGEQSFAITFARSS